VGEHLSGVAIHVWHAVSRGDMLAELRAELTEGDDGAIGERRVVPEMSHLAHPADADETYLQAIFRSQMASVGVY
jgi:hypothetical protein